MSHVSLHWLSQHFAVNIRVLSCPLLYFEDVAFLWKDMIFGFNYKSSLFAILFMYIFFFFFVVFIMLCYFPYRRANSSNSISGGSRHTRIFHSYSRVFLPRHEEIVSIGNQKINSWLRANGSIVRAKYQQFESFCSFWARASTLLTDHSHSRVFSANFRWSVCSEYNKALSTENTS